MNVLVTGGSGFIGSRLVSDLLAKGHRVSILDKVQSTRYPELCRIGNVRDPAAVDAAVKGIDLVYHLAAEHRDDVRPISLYYEVNVEGTRKLTEACSENGVSRIVFTSSVAVYGLNAGTPSEESHPKPFNDYGSSKLQGEEVLRQWAGENHGVSLTIVRPTVVFGEGNRGNVYNLINQIVSGRFLMVGDGRNRKSMAYVGNVAAFLMFVGELGRSGIRVFNYVDKPDFSMSELVSKVRTYIGKSPTPLVRIPYRMGMLGGTCFDMLAVLTGKNFPISRIRVEKFCADTTISIDALQKTEFISPYSLDKGMEHFLTHEFVKKSFSP